MKIWWIFQPVLGCKKINILYIYITCLLKPPSHQAVVRTSSRLELWLNWSSKTHPLTAAAKRRYQLVSWTRSHCCISSKMIDLGLCAHSKQKMSSYCNMLWSDHTYVYIYIYIYIQYNIYIYIYTYTLILSIYNIPQRTLMIGSSVTLLFHSSGWKADNYHIFMIIHHYLRIRFLPNFHSFGFPHGLWFLDLRRRYGAPQTLPRR